MKKINVNNSDGVGITNENGRAQGAQGSRKIKSSNDYDNDLTDTTPTLIQPDTEHFNLFWQRYHELEEQSPPLVRGRKLKASLVSSNKFFVGDAVLIVEFMLKTGQIVEVDYNTYRKVKS